MFSESQKQIIISSIILVVVVIGGLWYYQYMFGAAKLKRLDEEIAKSRTQLDDLKAKRLKYIDLQNREAEILAMREQVEQAAQRLPREANENQIHDILSRVMKETNVYSSEVRRVSAVNRQLYSEIVFEFECLARYHNLGELFTMIEENKERFLRIREFTVSNTYGARGRTSQDSRPSIQYARVQIVAYTFRAESLTRNVRASSSR